MHVWKMNSDVLHFETWNEYMPANHKIKALMFENEEITR